MAIAITSQSSRMAAGPSNLSRHDSSTKLNSPRGFDVVASYRKALEDERVPHPIAAILALVSMMEASTATTVTGLAQELTYARQILLDTQPSIGVRAGCQLWERFFALSQGSEEFPVYKAAIIQQGRQFCEKTAPACRERIAAEAVKFLRDDCTILTHSYSRPVIESILAAQRVHKRVKVYVTEGRPACLGLRTHRELNAAGIPCTVVLDSAVAYIMERVDMVLVGSEAVVESGVSGWTFLSSNILRKKAEHVGLVSSVGTYQVALIAKAMSKPFYALAESYKFLRHYPLSQTDLPIPRLPSSSLPSESSSLAPLSFPPSAPQPRTVSVPIPKADPTETQRDHGDNVFEAKFDKQEKPTSGGRLEMTKEMEEMNPLVDVTTPDLIDFIITDLGSPLSPTSVSQYLVAQFSS